MSFSLRLPEEEPVCECKYDQNSDRMDREDCPFHCHMVDDFEAVEPAEVLDAGRKPPASVGLAGEKIAPERRRGLGG